MDKDKEIVVEEEKKNGFLQTTKNVANTLKGKTKSLFNKIQQSSMQKKLAKLNPLFPDEYFSLGDNLPNIICIVDDAVRRDNELCQGAIGWRENCSGAEVLFLYDNFLDKCGLDFLPVASCDSLYYVDVHNKNRYIQVEHVFTRALDEKLAELKHIAFCLGAKKCSIEICESTSETNKKSSSLGLDKDISIDTSSSKTKTNATDGKIEVEFEGTNTVQKPTLVWFAKDDTILRLIEMRANGTNAVKSETIKISGSTSATLSLKVAVTLDNVIKSVSKIKGKMESSFTQETKRVFIFKIEY